MEALGAALSEAGHEVTLQPIHEVQTFAWQLTVVDSYERRADDLLAAGGPIAALDDLGRDLAVALVVDPSPGAHPIRHYPARVLAGPAYALLDPALASLPVRPIGPTVERVLVTTGASPDDSAAGGAARVMAEAVAAQLGPGRVTLVRGSRHAEDLPRGVSALEAADGLGPHLSDYDIVLTAGGVTLLESLCLGRPTVAVAVAGNQQRAVEGAASAGACLAAPVERAAEQAARLASDFSLRRRLSASARKLVDGRGAFRVANAVAHLDRRR